MASMKDFLEKTILRVGSRGAMPGGNIVVVLDSDRKNLGNSNVSYIAPTDGYLNACSKNGTPAGNLHMYNRTSGNIFSAYSPASVNTRVKGCIQAKKGDVLEVSSYSNDFIVNRIDFVKSVGGGGLKSLIYKLFPEVRHAYA